MKISKFISSCLVAAMAFSLINPASLRADVVYTLKFDAGEGTQFLPEEYSWSSANAGDVNVGDEFTHPGLWYSPSNEVYVAYLPEVYWAEFYFIAPEGKMFDHWVDQDGNEEYGGTKVPFFSEEDEDKTFTAVWKKLPDVKYNISFDPNGGSGTMETEQREDGRYYIVPYCEFDAPANMVFDYWYVTKGDSDYGARYYPGDIIEAVEDDLHFMAEWEYDPDEGKVTVLFDKCGEESCDSITINGIEGTTASVSGGETVNVAVTPKSGYKVVEMSVEPNPGYYEYGSNAITYTQMNDGSFVVISVVPEVNVTFDFNGGTRSDYCEWDDWDQGHTEISIAGEYLDRWGTYEYYAAPPEGMDFDGFELTVGSQTIEFRDSLGNLGDYCYYKLSGDTSVKFLWIDPDARKCSYIDDLGEVQEADNVRFVSSDVNTWDSNYDWYVVKENVTIPERVTIDGYANIILCDGATLTLPKGMYVDQNQELRIYGQTEGTGKIVASNPSDHPNYATIGGNGNGKDSDDCGEIYIYGGTIIASNSGDRASVIGGGYNEISDTLMICRGTISTEGGFSGIGSGKHKDPGDSWSCYVYLFGGTTTVDGTIGGKSNDYINFDATDLVSSGEEEMSISATNYVGRITLRKDFTDGTELFEASSDYLEDNSILAGKTMVPHFGHKVADATWKWSEDYTEATVDTKCTLCGKEFKDVVAEVDTQTADDGTVTHIAQVTIEGTDFSDTVIEYKIAIDDHIEGGTVTSDKTLATKDTEVKLTVVPDDEMELTELTVTDSEGNTVDVTKDSDGKYVFTMPESKVNVSAVFAPVMYSVTVDDQITGGTITSDKPAAAKGDEVKLTVTPDDQMKLADLTVTDGEGNDVDVTIDTDGKYVFTMPGSDVTVTAAFDTVIYNVTIDDQITGGTVSADKITAAKGTEVTLIVAPDDHMEFVSITVTDGDGNAVDVTKGTDGKYTFTMPGSDVTVTASFTAVKYKIRFLNEDGTVLQSEDLTYGVTPKYNGATPTKASDGKYTYEFSKWSENITAVTGDKDYVAQYKATKIPEPSKIPTVSPTVKPSAAPTKPATPTPTKKPATPTPTKGPARPTTKPATPTPAKKPATPTPTKKPAKPTTKPATPTPTKKPATPTPTRKPATPTPTKKPAKPTATPTTKPDGRISVAKAKVEFEYEEYTYYGTPIRPRIAVFVNGKQLKGGENNDFVGKLKNNDKVGMASITITGCGKYKDEITKEFKIVAPTVVCGKKLNLTEVDVTGTAWKSSNKNILTVKNGVVTGKQAGSATVSFNDGDTNRKFTVQVLYKDVKNSKDFWYEPTYMLTNKGVVKGYDNQTNFKPANECSRAQMVTFLWRLAGQPKPKKDTTDFRDVNKPDYYYKPVLWAVEKGITTGVSKTKFNPDGICTRAQAVTFLWRMAGKPEPKAKKSTFSDVKKTDYFYKATIWASDKKIVAGYSDGTFKPQGKCLRRQMVTFLYKYDKYMQNK